MDVTAAPRIARSGVSDDELLWNRSLSGDSDAFGLLFDKHRHRVFLHAMRQTHSRQEAEDVMASAFLELWRRRSDVRLVNGSMMPWLLVTTMNLGRNSARGTRRYRRLLERLPRAPDQPDIADTAFRADVDTRLRTALRSLSARDAQLFALVALEGYSVAEAAQCLCLSTSAAESRLHRARLRLRRQLGDMLGE